MRFLEKANIELRVSVGFLRCNFMKTIKNIIEQSGISSEFASKLVENEHIFNEIYKECNYSFIPGDGSYLFEGSVYEYCAAMHPKQELLYNLAKDSTSILEIGVYMGHSLLIMLLANPSLKITAIDLVDTYAKPSIDVLKKHFPNADIRFRHGDSLEIVPLLKTINYDLFHIDGHHLEEHIRKEINFCEKISSYKVDERKAMRVVFDDVHCCSNFINEILSKNHILKYTKPDCIWTNSYIEYFL